jgi:tRNA(adenine34) deaminase
MAAMNALPSLTDERAVSFVPALWHGTNICAETAVRCYNDTVVEHLNMAEPGTAVESRQAADEFWMRLALQQAAEALALGEVPVGAIAVFDGQVVGTGFNRKESDQDPTAHAEMIALRQAAAALANWRLIGVTLYCTLEPCPMCAGAMIQGRLSRLVYGAKDTRFGADGTVVDVLRPSLFNHQVVIASGILAEEAGELLQRFFRTLRKG